MLQLRNVYKAGLLEGAHPLKASDTEYVRFYKPDPSYRVKAVFVQVTGARPFVMNTKHGDRGVAVREYGIVYFNLKGGPVTLHIYRLLTRPEDNTDVSIRLFIPFTDRTNYKETFCGGRYLDINAADLLNNDNVIIDFNKAYNPHTAYEKGYPYLICPAINSLLVEIKSRRKDIRA